MDAAASEFYKNGKYVLQGENRKLNAEQMVDYYAELIDKYPILSIEDALAEQDWKNWEIQIGLAPIAERKSLSL